MVGLARDGLVENVRNRQQGLENVLLLISIDDSREQTSNQSAVPVAHRQRRGLRELKSMRLELDLDDLARGRRGRDSLVRRQRTSRDEQRVATDADRATFAYDDLSSRIALPDFAGE